MADKREQWGSKLGFILAAAGSAVGLGNIWKFPYVAGESGGAAFLIVFLICIFIIGLPVLIGEILLGRTTQLNPVGAFKKLAKSKFWTAIGALGIITGFLILSFYSVVAGWSFGYIVESVKGTFFEFNQPTDAGVHFTALTNKPLWIISYLAIFLTVSMFFVYFGIKKGIERGSKILMPILFLLLLILMVRGLTLPGSSEGLKFLFNPDWSKISGQTILVALGQAFFTMSLGMGVMMTYGSYMSKNDNVVISATQVLILDTLISVIAGIAIFTAVFANGQQPNEGPGLIFHIIPVVFTTMPGGYIFSILFFVLLTIAAITSVMSLLEVVVAYFVDERGWKRKTAVLFTGSFAFILAVPSALSFNVMQNTTLWGKTFFDIVDYLSANIFLPLGGFFISIFVAWFWGFDKAVPQLKKGAERLFERSRWIFSTWKFLLRFIAPILILFVFLHSTGLLSLIFEK